MESDVFCRFIRPQNDKQTIEKTWNWPERRKRMQLRVIRIIPGAHETLTKGLEKRMEGLKFTKNRVYQNYSLTKIGKNSAKIPGELRKIAVTPTLVKKKKKTRSKTCVKTSQGYNQLQIGVSFKKK